MNATGGVGVKMGSMILIFILTIVNCLDVKAVQIASAGSGEWGTPATWVGGVVPTVNDTAIVSAGHTIEVIGGTFYVSRVVVNGTSSLTILRIYEDSELYIGGGLQINRSGSAFVQSFVEPRGVLDVGGNINFSSSNANAIISLAYSGSTLRVGGNVTFSSNGSIQADMDSVSYFVLDGAGAQSIQFNANCYLYNVVVNKSGGTATLTGSLFSGQLINDLIIEEGAIQFATHTIEGDGGDLIMEDGGILEFGANGVFFPAGFTNYTVAPNSTVRFTTTNTVSPIPGGANYPNLVISGSGTKTLDHGLVAEGNFTLTASTFTTNNHNMTIRGNYTTSGGTFNQGTSIITLGGSNVQNVSAGSIPIQRLTVNKTGGHVALLNNLEVANTLTLTAGVISTGDDTLYLSNTNAASLAAFSSSSFVNGFFKREIATNTSTYSFPVGNGTGSSNYYRFDLINNNLTTTSNINVSFRPLTNHNHADLVAFDPDLSYQSLANDGVWFVEPNNQPGSGSYDVRAYIANISHMEDNEFGVLKRPSNSTTAADWSTGGGSLNAENGTGRMVADGFSLRMGLSSFSQFGIGREKSAAALPVELTQFNVTAQDRNKVLVQWVTATETHSDYFIVERSVDGKNYHQVGQIEAAGKSSDLKQYRWVDTKPFRGVSYYRLVQVDYDGTSEKFPAKSVKLSMVAASIRVFPNPVSKGNQLRIMLEDGLTAHEFSPIEGGTAQWIRMETGQLIEMESFEFGNDFISIPATMSSGNYILKIVSQGEIYYHKIFVQ